MLEIATGSSSASSAVVARSAAAAPSPSATIPAIIGMPSIRRATRRSACLALVPCSVKVDNRAYDEHDKQDPRHCGTHTIPEAVACALKGIERRNRCLRVVIVCLVHRIREGTNRTVVMILLNGDALS